MYEKHLFYGVASHSFWNLTPRDLRFLCCWHIFCYLWLTRSVQYYKSKWCQKQIKVTDVLNPNYTSRYENTHGHFTSCTLIVQGAEKLLRDFGPCCHESITQLLRICQLHIHDVNLHHIPKVTVKASELIVMFMVSNNVQACCGF